MKKTKLNVLIGNVFKANPTVPRRISTYHSIDNLLIYINKLDVKASELKEVRFAIVFRCALEKLRSGRVTLAG
ncbi:hypothetical protein ABF87_02465 [Nitrosomonas sp. JL21]|nr:hypothetical protein [Nitrosomonas sp. JL21]